MSTATDRTATSASHAHDERKAAAATAAVGLVCRRTPAICPGGSRAIPTASGSARSCCSRRRWRRSAITSSGSSRRFPTSTRSPPPTSSKCCGCGKGSATIAGRGNCTRRRRKSSPEHGGRFPRDVDALQELPGIGRYTAGAIASIAFDQRAPILEANTIRLLSRLIAYRDDPLKAAGQRVLWQTAADILPQKNVARFNQALMELGSLVCTPADPKCDACPLVERLCGVRRRSAAQDPAAKSEAGIHRTPRSGRRHPPQRQSADARMRRRRTLGRPVGFPAIRARKPKGRSLPAKKSSTKFASKPASPVRRDRCSRRSNTASRATASRSIATRPSTFPAARSTPAGSPRTSSPTCR